MFNIFAAINIYYLFRVKRMNLVGLAKGSARWVDMGVSGMRRIFAWHAEPMLKEKKAESNKVYQPLDVGKVGAGGFSGVVL